MCRTMCEGKTIITTHPCRDGLGPRCDRLHFLTQRVEPSERIADLRTRDPWEMWRHGHDAKEVTAESGDHQSGIPFYFPWLDASARRWVRGYDAIPLRLECEVEIYLKKDFSVRRYSLDHSLRIQRMDHTSISIERRSLIALNLALEVPGDLIIHLRSQCLTFAQQLLHSILTEVSLPQLEEDLDITDRKILRDHDESHSRRKLATHLAQSSGDLCRTIRSIYHQETTMA